MATICNSAVGINKGAKKRFSVNIQVCTLHTCINDIHLQGEKKKKKNKGRTCGLLAIFKHEKTPAHWDPSVYMCSKQYIRFCQKAKEMIWYLL